MARHYLQTAEADKELRASRVGVLRARHGQHAKLVEAGAELGRHVVPRAARPPLALRALVAAGEEPVRPVTDLSVGVPTLNHEPGDDAMEGASVEEALLGKLEEGLNVLGCDVIPQLKLHLALGRHHGQHPAVARFEVQLEYKSALVRDQAEATDILQHWLQEE